MAIRPLPASKLTLPYRKRKAGTVDFEWHPRTYQFRCAVVWYRGRPLRFTSVIEFLAWFIKPENDGLQLWAHYGGRADFAFVVPELIKAKIPCDGLVNGSSVFALTLALGRRRYYLRDSFFLTMSGLEDAARTFVGRGKLECSFEAPLKELFEYCEEDAKLLDEVLANLDDLWAKLGTHIRLTNASTAFSLFLHKYLSEVIPTNTNTNATFRKRAFFASIVCVYCRSVKAALKRSGAPYAVGYDQNSAHTESYCGPMPGREVLGSRTRPTDPELLWFADCEITVPDTLNIPPIPRRQADGRIFHPTGSWRALLFKEQVDLLEDCGGSVDKVHWYYAFKVNRDLEQFGRTLFELKSEARKANDAGLETVAKYALNGGGFGKFCERPERMQLVLGPLPEKFLYDKHGKPLKSAEKIRMLSPTINMVPTFRPSPHEHVPMGCVTGGRSMVRLVRDTQLAEAHGAIVLYDDTDGFKCTLPTDGWAPNTGDGLGQNKLEYPRIEDGYFAGPKFYGIKDTTLMQTIVRAKAFPVAKYGELVAGKRGKRKGLLIASDEDRPISSLITYEKVQAIAEAWSPAKVHSWWPEESEPGRETEATVKVQFERMRRIPETLAQWRSKRLPDLSPGSAHVIKLPRAPRPSRCFDSEGFSRPWALEELVHGQTVGESEAEYEDAD